MIRIVALALLVGALLCSCTPAAATSATQVATVVEDVCLPIVSMAAPTDEPLCVLGDELANAIIAYVASHAGTAPAVVTATNGRTAVGPDLYDALASRPGIQARVARPRCPKPAAGTVAP